MTFSRWQIKQLIEALDTARAAEEHDLATHEMCFEGAQLRRAKAKSDRRLVQWRLLKRDLENVLFYWKKDRRFEI